MLRRDWNAARCRYAAVAGLLGASIGMSLGTPAHGSSIEVGETAIADAASHNRNGAFSDSEPFSFDISLLPVESNTDLQPVFSDLQLLPDLFLPRYPSFNSQLLDQQLVLYSIHLFLSGPPDVLVVGSSRAIQGVHPETLQKTLIEQGYPKLNIYNFSINGATAQVIDLLLREILTPDQLPKLVVWADGARAFNSGRADRTFAQIADSDGFQQLKNGMHPILVRATDVFDPVSCQDYFAPQFSDRPVRPSSIANLFSFSKAWGNNAFSNAALIQSPIPWAQSEKAETRPPLAQAASCMASVRESNAPLAAQKSTRQPSALPHTYSLAEHTSSTHFLPPDRSSDVNLAFAPLGASEALSPALSRFIATLPFDLDVTGFLPNPTEFEPTTYYQTYPYVAGEYDSNYIPFELNGVQTEATRTLSRYMQSRDVSLAFINLPLTQHYLDPTRSRYEAEFVSHMQQLAAQEELLFIDLNQVELAQNRYFADPSHLNQYGARAVANHLAQQAELPWPN